MTSTVSSRRTRDHNDMALVRSFFLVVLLAMAIMATGAMLGYAIGYERAWQEGYTNGKVEGLLEGYHSEQQTSPNPLQYRQPKKQKEIEI